MTTNYEVDNIENAVPVKRWTKGVAVEDAALRQLANVARLPFIHKWVAAMPDVHWGMGATVGSVIPTKGAIVPAAVGVDLGCGMMAIETSLRAEDLPDNLAPVRAAIERAVPHGRTGGGGRSDRGAWSNVPTRVGDRWASELASRFEVITDKHPKIANANHVVHLGTLGTGNHFIELCLDERDHVWVMLHSGSRGIGNRIGSYFIALAREEMKRWFVSLPDDNLAYFPEGTEHFDDYVEAVGWAQDFARINRELMMAAVLSAIEQAPGLRPFSDSLRTAGDAPAVRPGSRGGPPFPNHASHAWGPAMAVNCHHNYVERERHYGANVWVTRKGAVRAGMGELGIIPGSMGAKSFIVRGKGNPESFCSCSHGAGRAMSRTEARKRFSLAEHAEATKHVECRKDEAVIDETPAAYKPIEAVMAAQADLVEVVHTLRQVVCVKG